ncbi:MAG: hypothetical protein WAW42_17970 [Candidatus Competibacteraceae bacterium]
MPGFDAPVRRRWMGSGDFADIGKALSAHPAPVLQADKGFEQDDGQAGCAELRCLNRLTHR